MPDRSRFLATAMALAAATPPGPRVPHDREPTEAPAARFDDVTATALDTRARVDLDRSLAALAARTQRELAPDSLARRGLAVGDVDGDGREDLFVCQPGGVPDLLLVQRPAGGFEERAAELRLDLLDDTAAALWVDLDGDGDLDLVTALGAEVLVHEQRAAYETRELTHESMRTETALVRLRQGDPVEALKHLRAACELAPDFAPALALRGRVQLGLGLPDEALDDLERALHLRPLEPRALEALSRAYDLLGVEATARALESLGRLQDPVEVARLASAVRPDHATPEAPAARASGEERPR